jgi:hypothetical protein
MVKIMNYEFKMINSISSAVDAFRRHKWARHLEVAGVLALSFIIYNSQFITAFAQQPQAPAGTPLYSVNAKYVNGMAPGYWPTAGTGLVLNLSSGTAYCGNPPVPVNYPGGSLALTASATNYVYLDPASNCSPAVSTSAFAAGQIPVATAVTGASSITSITDLRTWFQPQPCVMGPAGDLHCSSLGNNQNISLSPSGSGATVITNLADKGGQVYNVSAYGDAATALAAIPSTGGVLYFPDGNYTISSTLTSSHPVTVRLPCGTITANAQLFNGSSNDIKFIGCGAGYPGSGDDVTPTGTTVIKAGASYPAATDMIYVGASSRSTYSSTELSGILIKNVSFDMNSNTGNPFRLVSSNYSQIEGVKAWNCVNCGEVDGGLAGDPQGYASYHTTISHSQFTPVASSTGTGFAFNAQNGEVTYIKIDNSWFSGNIVNGGSTDALLFEAGSAAADSIQNVSIDASYVGNPVCSSSSHGIRFEAPGDYQAATGGRITNVNIKDTLVERLFSCALGYPIAGTSGGSAGTAGLGSFHLDNVSAGSYWASNINSIDLGSGTVQTAGDQGGPMSSQPILRVGGAVFGNNSSGLNLDPDPQATADSDILYGLRLVPTFSDNSKTGVRHIIAEFSTGSSVRGDVDFGYSNHLTQSGNGIGGTCVFASATTCSVTYGYAFQSTPIVVLTPVNPGAVNFTLTSSSATGFTITASASNAITVNYVAIGNPD